MTRFPKPRGFWDYTLFALAMTLFLMFLFWIDVSSRVGWADAVLASATAVLLVFVIILARRGEKARWIAQPTWHVDLMAMLGAVALTLGSMYADGYILHRTDITSNWLRRNTVITIVVAAVSVLLSLRRYRSRRHLS